MPIYYQKDDAIMGEKIGFECRKFQLSKRQIPSTSAHRAQKGKLLPFFP